MFNQLPVALTGTSLLLKVAKNSNLGIADLYIDNAFNQSVDLYSPALTYGLISVTGLSAQNHNFFVTSGGKNPASTGTGITLDAKINNYISASISGTGFDYIAKKGTNQGKAEVYLDGALKNISDLYSATTLNAQNVASVRNLVNTSHNVTIFPNGTSTGNSINLDAIDEVFSTGTGGGVGND